MHALVGHYRFSHDHAWLERVYPALVHAAGFVDDLRARTASEGPETRGLLPSNLSAEDLGSATWHHYWDDLWALAGYRDVAFAARELERAGGRQSGRRLTTVRVVREVRRTARPVRTTSCWQPCRGSVELDDPTRTA